MMKLLSNLKDPITDLLGLFIIGLTLYEKYTGSIEWIWEGTAGLCLGAVFFMFPDQWIKDSLNALKDKLLK